MADRGPAAAAFARGEAAFQTGRIAEAIEAWSAAERQATAAGDPALRMDALLRRADGYQTLGLLPQAAADLEACHALAATTADSERQAIASGMLGSVYLTAGRTEDAGRLLRESLDLAERHALPAVRATTLSNLGLLMTLRRQPREALVWFDRSLAVAQALGDPALLVRGQINRSRAALTAGQPELAGAALDAAGAALSRMEPTPEKAQLLLARAVSLLRLQEPVARLEPAFARSLEESLGEAAVLAGRFEDRRTLSFAEGYLGRLYEKQQRTAEALDVTRTAVHLAQQTGAPALLYQWHWQIGRLLQARGDSDRAIQAYQRAVESAQQLRLSQDQPPDGFGDSFYQTVGPLYQQLADLLLRRAEASTNADAAQADLRTARNTIELFRGAELEDYFRDGCVGSLQARTRGIERLPEHTAALYPVLLRDRTILILIIGKTLQQFPVPAGTAEMAAAVRELRRRLERVAIPEYLGPAQRLYDLLIRPLEPVLAQHAVTTLVFVPDGPLRTMPLAALHDGHKFLVERYASVVVPGLTLVDPGSIPRQRISVLLNALMKGVQGFQPLPYVAEEVTTIEGLFTCEVLENETFTAKNVQKALARRPFTIVHIASHGAFSREAKDSFVLTFDDRLSLDQLEQLITRRPFSNRRLELLVLSACEMASEDERAAIGLTGLAVKADARSAVASLWYINDEAAAMLISAFYRELRDETVSKAEVLRRAQLSLIHDRRYRHPGYWSPFLLIGNWF